MKIIEMLKIVLMLTFLVVSNVFGEEDYIDPVIDMLLNGVSEESVKSDNIDDDSVSAAVWKCGNCTDLGTAQLIHSQTNLVDAEEDEQDVNVQISLAVTNMRCVTVNADQPAAVRKVVGSCNGSSVTLDVSPSHNFTILVYT